MTTKPPAASHQLPAGSAPCNPHPATCNLRFAEGPDLPNLMALINKAFRVETFFIQGNRLSPEDTLAYFKKGRFLLVAEEPDSLCAASQNRRPFPFKHHNRQHG